MVDSVYGSLGNYGSQGDMFNNAFNSYQPGNLSSSMNGFGSNMQLNSSGSNMQLSPYGAMPNAQELYNIDFANGAGQNPGFLESMGGFQGIGSILGGLGGLAQAYIGSQQLGLAEDSLDFQKGAFNKNMANQAQMVNSSLKNRYENISNMAGAGRTSRNYGTIDKYVADRGVDGGAI